MSEINWDADPNIIRKEVIPVRLRTPTREPIELVVVQRVDDNKNVTTPVILVRGEIPRYIESWQFALDYGAAWIVAGFFALRWTAYLGGKR
jgi:hypothetical protein